LLPLPLAWCMVVLERPNLGYESNEWTYQSV
jgi:hypothetical protein